MAKKDAKRAPRQTVDRSNESKADKFKRLGNKRLNKALKAIKNIGNLSGAGYERTPDQVKTIQSKLDDAVKTTMARFTATAEKKAAVEENIL